MRHARIARRVGRAPLVLLTALVVAASLAVAGCGGGSSTGAGAARAADFVPAGSPVYLEISTDAQSPQWRQAEALARKFPSFPKLERSLKASLAEHGVNFDRDVRPFLGAHAAVAVTKLPSLAAPSGGSNGLADLGTGARRHVAVGKDAQVLGVVEIVEGKEDAVRAELQNAAGGSASGQHAGVDFYRLDDGLFAAVSDGAALFASSQADLFAALDAHAAGGDHTLGGTARFKDAISRLPSDVFAEAYLDTGAITRELARSASGMGSVAGLAGAENAAVALSIAAEPDGVRLKGVVVGAPATKGLEEFTPTLTDHVPGDALAYVGVKNLAGAIQSAIQSAEAASPQVKEQIDALTAQLGPALGVSPGQLADLARLEHAFVVTRGAPVPTVAAILEQADGATAKRTADAIADHAPDLVHMLSPQTKLPAWRDVPLANGVTGRELPLSSEAGVVYGVDGNLLLIGSRPEGLRQIQTTVTPLSKSPGFVADTQGIPAKVTGLVWVNVRDAVALADSQGAFKDNAELLANLRHLQSVTAWGTGGSSPSVEVFLRIS
jgi:hypothetical protein